MPKLASKINPDSEDFKANAAHMEALVKDLREKVAKISLGGLDAIDMKIGLPQKRISLSHTTCIAQLA